jgi:DNA-binding transcriptional LysR family regulator
MKLKLRQVQHAVTLAGSGSYSAAAERLNLSQPALSRSIQALEALLGATLFDRTPTGVVPTTIGRLVIEQGAALLAGADGLEREVKLALGLETGSLAVGAAPYAADICVGTACGRLAMESPALAIDVRVGDWTYLTALVLSGELDIAVAELTLAADDSRLEVQALPQHVGQFFCRAEHPLACRLSVSLADTEAFPLVASSLPARFQNLRTAIRVDTFRLARDIVLASNAVGIATPSQIAVELRERQLAFLPISAPWLHSNYGFIRLKGRTPAPATLAFMRCVLDVEEEIARGDVIEGERQGPD